MEYTQQLLILCPLAFLAGFVDSIAGGGGLISLPAYYAVGLSPHLVIASNKFSASCGATISAIRFVKNKIYYAKVIIPSVIVAAAGSVAGAKLSIFLPEEILRYVLIIALPVVAVFILFKKDFNDSSGKKVADDRKTLILCLISSLLLGVYDGFFGPGTGTFLILIYTSVVGFDLLTSMGNAKIVNWVTNISAAVVFIINGKVLFSLAIPAAGCSILGNYIGTGLAIKNGKKIVRPIMIVVLMLLLVKVIYDTF